MRPVMQIIRAVPNYIGVIAGRVLAQFRSAEQKIVAPAPFPAQETKAVTAEWTLKRDILDRLDEYYSCMTRMKKHDPDSYEFFARVGCAVPSNDYNIMLDNLSDRKLGARLGFGGVVFPAPRGDWQKDSLYPSLVYFQKYERPHPTVQLFNGDVYEVISLYDDRKKTNKWKAKFAVPLSFHLGIDTDGRPHLLREFVSKAQTIRPKKKYRGRKRSITTLYRTFWALPSWLKEGWNDSLGLDSEARAKNIFFAAYDVYMASIGNILVAASKDDVTATFGIDLRRAPQFFSDRDSTALTPSGSKKRIFHHVREHDRRTGAGAVSVKEHYRGLRFFMWNGHRIRITWPGRNDLLSRNGIGVSALDAIDDYQTRNWSDAKDYGTRVAAYLESKGA